MNVSTGQQTASNAAKTPTMISEIGIVTSRPSSILAHRSVKLHLLSFSHSSVNGTRKSRTIMDWITDCHGIKSSIGLEFLVVHVS